jgi:enterochelin esterase family protein
MRFFSPLKLFRSAILLLFGLGLLAPVAPVNPAEAQRQSRGGRRRVDLAAVKLAGGSVVDFRSFESPALGMKATYSIFLPPSFHREQSRSYPAIYFLHGLNNDRTSWTVDRYGKIHEKLEAMMLQGTIPEFLMVHPDGANSFYCDYVDGSRNYEQFVTRDLIEHLEENYRAKKGRENRAIGGTSMGGYGALKIAMKFPHIYASVVGHSPIIFLGKNPLDVPEEMKSRRYYRFFESILGPIFGDPFRQELWDANNPLLLAREGDLSDLNIFFDYGTADRYNQSIHLDQGVKELHRVLTEAHVAHSFHEYPGEPHGWALVAAHLEESLPFLCQTFQ